ncbi:MAG TPA: AbgT family transporter [Phycisphaerales bacterium]|nr:AbgT family transporter [Phycisphaerales bacterium]
MPPTTFPDDPAHPQPRSPTPDPPRSGFRILDVIEKVGNKFPGPVLLFAMLAVLVIVLSAIGNWSGWHVQPVSPVLDAAGRVSLVNKGDPIHVRSLANVDGVYWMLANMVRNFTSFPPLGLVITCMLGIGVAERVGLFATLMRFLAMITPRRLLTPMIVLLGCNSSIASDAGYLILPPLAAGLFYAVGRHPLAGAGAAFAGVAGGFGAGVFITGADTVLAGFATAAGRVIDPNVTVLATTNWYFKAASVVVLTLAGWAVTDLFIERRLRRSSPVDTAERPTDLVPLSSKEKSALGVSLLVLLAFVALYIAMVKIPGWPLYGEGSPTPADRPSARWSQVIVPMMFFTFLAPGLTFGFMTGALRGQQSVCDAFYGAVKSLAPVIAMAFFAAQFLEYFKYSNLDRLMAFGGGKMLVHLDLPTPLLLVVFVVAIILADFAMSSMTAKFAVLAPIVIPMFMMVGVSPDLTTAGYRIGDSVVNIITPLNTYMPIVLLVLQKYRKGAGLGSLISLMVPYSLTFGVIWIAFLLLWYFTGLNLGPDAALNYTPPAH